MDLRGISSTEIFIPMGQQSHLEGLANNALSKGIDLYMRQDYKGAINEFRRSIGLSPGSEYSVDAANYMADAYLALNDTEGAIKAYKTSLRSNPYRDDIHMKLGNLHFAEERYEDAAVAYEKAVNLVPNADYHFALGQAYMNSARYTEADLQFNKVLKMTPEKPDGNFGLGLNYSRQGRYDDAIVEFKQALRLDDEFYAAYAELGYAYADSGDINKARDLLDTLRDPAPDMASTLGSYLYEVDPPKFMYAHSDSSFYYMMPIGTPVSYLDSYLENAGAGKTFFMTFQFDKEMDRASVENLLNWKIGRAAGSGPGQAYNFGLPVPDTEIKISPYPDHVYYDAEELRATVYFTIQQNASADGTIDPAHIEFKFSGKDIFGMAMDTGFDQFNGFSKVL